MMSLVAHMMILVAQWRQATAGVLAGALLLLGAQAAMAQSPLDDPLVLAMYENKFLPVETVVPAGTTLTWINFDAEDHSVVALDLSFSSPVVKASETWSYTFTEPGVYAYLCDLHIEMEAVIAVTQ